MANQHNVNIAGCNMVVQTDRSAAHMERLAGALNDRVREIQKTASTTNFVNVVMLAAMEFVDEVLAAEELVSRIKKERSEFEEKAARFETETSVLRERLIGIDEKVSALRQQVEELKAERERLQEKFERRSRDLLDVLDNALR